MRLNKPLTSLTAGLMLTAAASASVFYVDSVSRAESPTGTSWRSAFADLDSALEAASTNGGGQVWVRAGIYTPNGTSRAASFVLPADTELYGGFHGGETNLTQRNPKANVTKLSGDIGRPGAASDNSYHVVTAADGTRIDGFTIHRGSADAAAENRFGGGLRILPGSRNVTAANCTFEKNNAESGGAVHLSVGSLTLTNCTFYSNSADTGGAVTTLGQSSLKITDCIFNSNFAPKYGGALMLNTGTEAVITGSSFLYNSTDGFGGAAAANTEKELGIELTIEHCTFSENSARENGGALGLAGPFQPTIRNSSFEKNFSARGAGGIAGRNGTDIVLLDAAFSGSRGAKGREDFGFDAASQIIQSAAEAAALTARRTAAAPAEPEAAPQHEEERERKSLPDVFVYKAHGQSKIKLRTVAAEAEHTVLVLGDLTDDQFIRHYRGIEAAARDFHPKGIRFYYLYRYLKHPENNGYVKPFILRERAQHTVVAKQKLHTAVPWLCDAMDNEAAAALTHDSTNQVFLVSAAGEVVYEGGLGAAEDLRAVLTDFAGPVDSPFNADALPKTSFKPVRILEPRFAPRAPITRDDGFVPLEITPQDSRKAFYVKARVEASKELLATGDGKLYLGFHMDPLFNVQWNNLSDPLSYAVKTPQGVVAPSIQTAPRVTAAAADSEPREFVLEARKLDLSLPLQLQVSYSVHTADKQNIAVTQQYTIYLSEDKFGGAVIGRQVSKLDKEPQSAADRTDIYKNLLRRFDLDRNGKLTRDEVIGALYSNFDSIDQNGDGAIDAEEYAAFNNNR